MKTQFAKMKPDLNSTASSFRLSFEFSELEFVFPAKPSKLNAVMNQVISDLLQVEDSEKREEAKTCYKIFSLAR